MGFCSKGPKNEFEPAVVNEPSVFEPSKFSCKKFCAQENHIKDLKLPICLSCVYFGLTSKPFQQSCICNVLRDIMCDNFMYIRVEQPSLIFNQYSDYYRFYHGKQIPIFCCPNIDSHRHLWMPVLTDYHYLQWKDL